MPLQHATPPRRSVPRSAWRAAPSSTSCRRGTPSLLLVATSLVLGGCGLDGTDAERIDVPVALAAEPMTIQVDAEWTLELERCRGVVDDLVFTTGGRWYAAVMPALSRTAWAHPGHQGGGEIVGELRGRHIVDWCSPDHDGQVLGIAEVLGFDLAGANFTWGRATRSDVAEDDPLLDHSLIFEGHLVRRDTGGRERERRSFLVSLELPAQPGVVGISIAVDGVAEEGDVFSFSFVPAPGAATSRVPSLTESFFAGIDLAPWLDAALELPLDVVIEPGSMEHDRLRDAAMRHDYFEVGRLEVGWLETGRFEGLK